MPRTGSAAVARPRRWDVASALRISFALLGIRWYASVEVAGDHQLHDVGGALLDLLEFDVAHPLLHRVLTRISPAAKGLDGRVGDEHRRLGCGELRHRRDPASR